MSGPSKRDAEVVVIGGGIVGCAAAYYLSRRQRKVVLLEKSALGAEASGRNGGGVRAQCRDRRERPLAIASIRLWTSLEQEIGRGVEYIQGGNIRMATNEERMDALRKEGEEELADGLPIEIWDRDELRRRAPYLSDMFIGAKFCPMDGQANPLLAAPAVGWAAKRAGATVLTRTEALAIGIEGGRVASVTARGPDGEISIATPWVIHAAGPWTPQLSQTLGISLPIAPARSVLAITERLPALFKEFVSSHDLGAYCRQAREGHVHIGGVGAPGVTFDQTMPPDAVGRLAAAGLRVVPALRGASILRTWAGTLENTPDKVPIIDAVGSVPGYIVASGFSGHGFCLGPIAGKLVSEMIADGAPSLSLEEFRLARFAGTGSS
ncbi:MAG TPA: FAD-dependent oxidoreductase [Candidatus Baltobacteraceae bacterium]|nr:FAD-dependent oxidoreductase [Candidatus Baltobacteraceae bacterium]